MKLQFTTGPKDVPIKTTITRRLLTAAAPQIDKLREAGRNKALQNALLENPAAIAYLSGDWVAGKRKEYAEAYPMAGEKFINEQVQKALAATLTEEFPDVFKAMTNPVTDIDYDNDDALAACFGLLLVILDRSQLLTEEIAELDAEGFFDEQDLAEVVAAVNQFRGLVKL